MTSDEPGVAWLEERFLRRDRGRLDEARAMARQTREVPALMERFEGEGWIPPSFGASAGERWFRTGRAHAERPGDVRLEGGLGRPVSPSPGTVEHVCYVAVDAADMEIAERHARALAEACWRASGTAGAPPVRVVWRLSGWGGAPRQHLPGLLGLSGRVPVAPLPDRSPLFGWVAEHVERRAAWDALRRSGEVPDADWVRPLLSLWGTGFGLWDVTPDAIHLVQPVGTVPTRLPPERRPAQLAVRDLANGLRRLAPGEVLRALADGARPDPNAVGDVVRNLSWQHARHRPLDRWAEAVRALLEAGALPFGVAMPPLALAVLGQRQDLVPMLVEAGIHVDTGDARGRTALHALAAMGHATGVERLLPHGPDPDARDELGWSPAHVALYGGHPHVLQALEAGGARLDLPTGRGASPASLVAHHPPALQETLAPWVRSVPAVVPVDVELPEIPPVLASAVRDGVVGSRTVLADWLTEHGDPRGVAMALEASGADEARRAAAIASSRVRRALVAVHPGVEALLSDAAVVVEEHAGFLVRLTFLRGAAARHADALRALLESGQLPLLERVEIHGGGEAVLRALDGARAPVPREVRVLGLAEPPGPLSLGGLSGLRGLALQGEGVVDTDLAHPTLAVLVLELPNLRDRELGSPIRALRTPSLSSLSVATHRAAHGPEAGWLSALARRPPASLTSLALRPATDDLLHALRGTPLLERLRWLALDSCFPDTVDRLLDDPAAFAHLDRLAVTVVRAGGDARRPLQQALREVVPNATVAGIGLRGPGSYGDGAHPRGARGPMDPGPPRR